MRSPARALSCFLFLSLSLFSINTRASTFEIPRDLGPLVLSESLPSAFAPINLSGEDFEVKISGDLPLTGQVVGKSIEWVRAERLFVLPRGRLILKSKDSTPFSISYNGTQVVSHLDNTGTFSEAELTIALFTFENYPIRITAGSFEKPIQGSVNIRYFSQKNSADRIAYDSTCSSFRLTADELELSPTEWIYFSCRMVYVKGAHLNTINLELYFFWEGTPTPVIEARAPLERPFNHIFQLSLKSAPNRIQVASNASHFKINFRVPDRQNMLSLGLGIGPYIYQFYDQGNRMVNTVAPLATLYGSLFMNEFFRIVSFSAFPIHRKISFDTGLYAVTEQIKLLDDRASVNLLLGANLLSYPLGNKFEHRISIPQGIEIIVRDFSKRLHSTSIGGFFYPKISDRSYYNIWARYSFSGIFLELNYLSWTETPELGREVVSTNSGLSVGFPLGKFL